MRAPAVLAPVTVVIPYFDAASTIEDALQSVLAQSPHPAEVIVVDDCSPTPLERETLAHLLVRFPGSFEIVRLSANGGPSAARNEGWGRSSQEYVAFLDADDRWASDALPVLLDIARRHPGSVLFGGAFARPADTNPPTGGASHFNEVALAGMIRRNPLCTSATMVRAGIDERFDEDMRHSEDWDLWLRVIQRHGAAAVTDRALALRRNAAFTGSGLSGNVRAMRLGELRAVSKLRKTGALGPATAALIRAYLTAKYARRLVIVAASRLVRR